MVFQKRKQKILQVLEQEGDADIHQLAVLLGTSEITIRRDLNRMAADGMLYRTHGGATKVDPLAGFKFENKTAVNQKAKDEICRRAAAEIQDGDIIFMDCGSTVYRLCQFIRNKKIKVITNSLPVVFELHNSQVSINLIGGEVDHARQAVHGSMAEEHIASYRATKAFLGVDGISVNGLFAQSEKEASITLAIARQSEQTYILCDSSKIGRESYLKFAELDLIDTIITDYKGAEVGSFTEKGITVIAVK
ncbi:DeoR/GlpR family DNA-binding transcription regulator [Mucilaginibacter sp. BJC16-A38]|uniref:DeoR/GlpR family DNA-binding transcription regulator n=1 Tax=Mucilaginibacter phenanthrenivorans TaxID=1234842 RepID=UPI00215869B3|nr:DeoR/GlpR family DNA-binding transcription regulator [Mucilaginibacter phenanthrenivorans]MCR8557587.1 DeoR/GlpR family DNA-binding transcription regulator [Mucilaginibacter phenanthrenivorans]